MRYVEMSREEVFVAGHMTSEEIYEWKQKGYTLKTAEKIDYHVYKQQPKKYATKKVIYNKAGVRIG